ncbi:hypothetical protein BSPWISOXPB_4233 [uncultured Gammaproteobacteria bacterium]|nr:hypothetical protein BSPWISOXPB_4233 [uncultured Gammaproteobacteria bacterium]
MAFGYFNGFWWFFYFKNSGFVFNERVGLYFYDKRVVSPFPFFSTFPTAGSKIKLKIVTLKQGCYETTISPVFLVYPTYLWTFFTKPKSLLTYHRFLFNVFWEKHLACIG